MYFVASYWDKRKLSQMVRYGFLQWSLWVYLPSIGFPTKKDESFMLITHHVLYVYVPYSYLNTVKTSAAFFFSCFKPLCTLQNVPSFCISYVEFLSAGFMHKTEGGHYGAFTSH